VTGERAGKIGAGALSKKLLGESALKNLSKVKGLWRANQLKKGIGALTSDQQSAGMKIDGISDIGQGLSALLSRARRKITPQYSLGHLLSKQTTEMVLGGLKEVHGYAIQEFKDSMAKVDRQLGVSRSSSQPFKASMGQFYQGIGEARARRVEEAAQRRAQAAAEKRARQQAEAEARARQAAEDLAQRARRRQAQQERDPCAYWNVDEYGNKTACARYHNGSICDNEPHQPWCR